jgi:hypothetical protein
LISSSRAGGANKPFKEGSLAMVVMLTPSSVFSILNSFDSPVEVVMVQWQW